MSVVKQVLLLNSGEQVINVIDWKRAVILFMQGKAKRPYGHEDEYDIRTAVGVFKLPSVLVLVEYVRLPYKKLAVSKENVLRRDSFECQYCGKRLSRTTGTVDHVIPQCRKGKNVWANVVAACKPCNGKKDNRTPLEANMKLRCRPYTPSRDALVLTAIDLRTNKTWERWVIT